MLKTQAKLKGDLAGDLARFSKKVQGEVCLSGVAAMARVMYDEAKRNAELHKKTGHLHDAIYRKYMKDKSTDSQKIYKISWNAARDKAPHGKFLEFGTSRAPAYPFMTPAFDHAREAIKVGKARMAERLAGLHSAPSEPGGAGE